MLLRIMLRWKSCLKMIKVNKPEPKDASHDNMDNFNEDNCEVCLLDAEYVVHSTENNVEVQELFEDIRN